MNKKLIIGSHVLYNAKDQLLGCVEQAISYGENAFMFYTGAPQNTMRSPINTDKIEEAYKLMNENGIELKNVIVHAPYIVNLANNKVKESYEFAISFLRQELDRCIKFGVKKIVLHPGSHVGLGIDTGIENIINALNRILKEEDDIKICLETMTGKGSELGDIDEINRIINGVKLNDKLMVCLDTCHMNDRGYDLTKFDEILDMIDKKMGINRIGCIHVNDSCNERGVRKDRHENIGFGKIGFDTLINIIYNERLASIPKILETPYITETPDSKEKIYPPFKEEIIMIKNKKFNPNMIEEIRKR